MKRYGTVAMCGDGGNFDSLGTYNILIHFFRLSTQDNDCQSMKAAHVGVSIANPHGDNVFAPFVSSEKYTNPLIPLNIIH
jgi:hypothetical protein